MLVSPGGVKLVRRMASVPEVGGALASVAAGAGESEVLRNDADGEVRRLLHGRASGGGRIREFSHTSRMNMRWTFSALPWDEIPGRLAMVTLTYPSAWRSVVPDGRVLKDRHLRRWKQRWEGAFGIKVMGAWAMEFQKRGAPHIHMYVGLPEASIEEFRLWALETWYRIVDSGDQKHAMMGVDVRPCFYGNAEANAARVADYFWRESGKQGQKTPPEGFHGVGRYWGYWQMRPRVHELALSRGEYVVVRRPVRTLQRKVAGGRVRRSRGTMDGLYVVGVDGYRAGVRLARWATELVQEQSAERACDAAEGGEATNSQKVTDSGDVELAARSVAVALARVEVVDGT
jgi:hypothetical protein